MKRNNVEIAPEPTDGDGRSRRNQSHAAEFSSGVAERTPLAARLAEAKSNLSSNRQQLLRRILEESDETFFLSSREMASRYDVNPATIIRTIQALGYEKFADFAIDLREHFVTKITPYHARKLFGSTLRTILRGETIYERGQGFTEKRRGRWVRRA